MHKGRKGLDFVIPVGASVEADAAAEPAGFGNRPAASPGPHATASIRLHDAELKGRIEAAFADHFRVPRRCRLGVRFNHLLKRLFDAVLLLLGSLVAIPLIAVAGVCTLLDTGRPIFYVQLRRVRFGRLARIYKMRTLLVGADQNLDALVSVKHHGKFLNITKDCSRYTTIGRWLERLWIVELPQLLNIARGEMSVVGNRPIPDYVIDALGPTAEVIERFASPQGLTGYVQAIGRDAVPDIERILLEYHYSDVYERGNVFVEDLKIVLYTIFAYFGKPITVAHFLGKDYKSRYGTFFSGQAAEACSASLEKGARLACPTCYTNSEEVRDKVPLDASMWCRQCGATYVSHEAVADLFPRNGAAQENPYIGYYQNEYLGQNPNIHLEDTQWKVNDLTPLLNGINGGHRSIVDVGCGAGELLTQVGEAVGCSDLTAVDCSMPILMFAKKRHPESIFLRVDAANLPFRNRSYDLSMLIDVIEHQAAPEQVLYELSRVSRRLLIRTPLEDCWYERLRRKHRDLFRESSGHVVHFNPKRVRAMLEANGFLIRDECIEHIAWSHWRNVLSADCPLHGKVTALVRFGLRFVLPKSLYRRLFVVNYNALCESTFHTSGAEHGQGER